MRQPTSYPTRAEVFSNTKADKRSIKHSILVSNIKTSGSADSNRVKKSGEKNLKRRRPQKKLVATLDSLADALPEFEDEDEAVENDIATVRKAKKGVNEDGSVTKGRQTNQSLKSRPGIMKRKAKIEALERQRFGMNIAMMAGRSTDSTALNAPAAASDKKEAGNFQDRWAALKRHVEGNMEKKAEFVDK